MSMKEEIDEVLILGRQVWIQSWKNNGVEGLLQLVWTHIGDLTERGTIVNDNEPSKKG